MTSSWNWDVKLDSSSSENSSTRSSVAISKNQIKKQHAIQYNEENKNGPQKICLKCYKLKLNEVFGKYKRCNTCRHKQRKSNLNKIKERIVNGED